MNPDGKLGRHQPSFDQEAADSEPSKVLKPVNRVELGTESRWDKAAADAYDLDLQQGGDADEAGAVRTLCIHMAEAPKRLTTQLCPYRILVSPRSEEYPKLIRISTYHHMRDDVAVGPLLESLGITVLHAGRKYHDSQDLVVVGAHPFPALPHMIDQFVLEDVNPTQITRHERLKLGNPKARTVAQRRFLTNALDAIFYTDIREPASCYRDIARKNGLLARLEALTFQIDFEVTLSVCLGGVVR
ncbi:MAG: hypothetical protein Q9217_001776 [Psora testacea]